MANLTPSSSSWQELLIDTLRLAARVAIRLNQGGLSEMKTLMGVALYRELKDEGETSEAMSVTLDCSLRTVKNLARQSREAAVAPPGIGGLRRVIKRLEAGPATREELDRFLPFSLEFDVSNVAYGVLESEGLVEPFDLGGQPGLALTRAWTDRDALDWEAPLGEVERLRRLGLTIFARLTETPQSLEDLAETPRLRTLDRQLVLRVLAFMEAEDIACRVEGGGEDTWTLPEGRSRMKRIDSGARWRQGLMYLMERLGLFLDVVLSGRREAVVSQHSISFDARPEDLKPFYQSLHTWVMEALTTLDKRAGAQGGGVSCQFVWFAAPTAPTSTVRARWP